MPRGSEVKIVASWDDRASKGVDKLTKEFHNLQKQLQFIQKAAAAAAVALVAMATGAATALGAMTKKVANLGDEIQKMSLRTGASTKFLSAMKLAVELSGESLETLEIGLRRLARNMWDVEEGLHSATLAFDTLGVSVYDSSGGLRKLEDIFLELADVFANMTDETKAAALAQEVFGRGGAALLPLLKQGKAAIEDQIRLAQKLGIVFSQEAADASAEFNDALVMLRYALTGVMISLTKLIPALTPYVERLTDFVIAHREAAEKGVEKLAKSIRDFYNRIAWEDLKEKVKKLSDTIQKFGDWCWDHRDFLAKAFVVASITAVTAEVVRLTLAMKALGATALMKFMFAHPGVALGLGAVAFGVGTMKHFQGLFSERWERERAGGGGGTPFVGTLPEVQVIAEVNDLFEERRRISKDLWNDSLNQMRLASARNTELRQTDEARVQLIGYYNKELEQSNQLWEGISENMREAVGIIDQAVWSLQGMSFETDKIAEAWNAFISGYQATGSAEGGIASALWQMGASPNRMILEWLFKEEDAVSELEERHRTFTRRLWEVRDAMDLLNIQIERYTGTYQGAVEYWRHLVKMQDITDPMKQLDLLRRMMKEFGILITDDFRVILTEMADITVSEFWRLEETVKDLGDEMEQTREAMTGYTEALTEQQKAIIRATFYEREIALRGRFARQVTGLSPYDPAYQYMFRVFRVEMEELGRQLDLALQHGMAGTGMAPAAGGWMGQPPLSVRLEPHMERLGENMEELRKAMEDALPAWETQTIAIQDFTMRWDEGLPILMKTAGGADRILADWQDVLKPLDPIFLDDWTKVFILPQYPLGVELDRIIHLWGKATIDEYSTWAGHIELPDYPIHVELRDMISSQGKIPIDEYKTWVGHIDIPTSPVHIELEKMFSLSGLIPIDEYGTWAGHVDVPTSPVYVQSSDMFDLTGKIPIEDWSEIIGYTEETAKLKPSWYLDILEPKGTYPIISWGDVIRWGSAISSKLQPSWTDDILYPKGTWAVEEWETIIDLPDIPMKVDVESMIQPLGFLSIAEKNWWGSIVNLPAYGLAVDIERMIYPYGSLSLSSNDWWGSIVDLPTYEQAVDIERMICPYGSLSVATDNTWKSILDLPDWPLSIDIGDILNITGQLPVPNFNFGGLVGLSGYQHGGLVDTVPAMLTPGEYVMPPRQTRQNLDELEAMRSGRGSRPVEIHNHFDIQAWDHKDVKRWLRSEGREMVQEMTDRGKWPS